MSTNERIDYSNLTDMALLELFKRQRDRDAVRELYLRYREPVGRFLYRGIKDTTAVADAFNNVMLRLISDSKWQSARTSLSARIFAMAYQLRLEYRGGSRTDDFTPHPPPTIEKVMSANRINALSQQHQVVLELVYQHDFSFEQTATILGCSMTAVRSCWSEAKSMQVVRHTGALHHSVSADSCR